MLMVNGAMVGVNASKIDAMTELGVLINTLANKGIINKEDALTIVEAAFMDKEELKKRADEVRANAKKAMDDKLKELLKEMLEELE